VISQLQSIYSEIRFDIRIIKTKGDVLHDVNLAKIGSKGVFVKEIEELLLSKDIDIAVHSLKDMPVVLPQGLKIGAVCKRIEPRDAFVSKTGKKIDEIPEGAVIGTSSPRRKLQIKQFRPELNVVELRGNLDTRIKKLAAQDIDGIIVACAGMYRMGLADKVTQVLPVELFLPSAGQGALAVEVRSTDNDICELINKIEHVPSRITTTAERAFLKTIGVGCSYPVGVYASISDNTLMIKCMVAEHRLQIEGDIEKAEELGAQLGMQMLQYVRRI
jgi:hydroxymethylbilane synthase